MRSTCRRDLWGTKPRHDEQCARQHTCHCLYDHLALFLLRAGPDLESPHAETGIRLQEIERDQENGGRKEKPYTQATQKCTDPAGRKEHRTRKSRNWMHPQRAWFAKSFTASPPGGLSFADAQRVRIQPLVLADKSSCAHPLYFAVYRDFSHGTSLGAQDFPAHRNQFLPVQSHRYAVEKSPVPRYASTVGGGVEPVRQELHHNIV